MPHQPPAYNWPDPDRDYANGDFIAGAEAYPAQWRAKAAAFRASLGARAQCDQRYGPRPRQCFDLFEPETEAKGTVLFVHGGWWLAFSREDWSHLAAGALARGWRVVMPSYTLAPEARISEITSEIKSLLSTLHTTHQGPMVATGHSAGGHLVARLACQDQDLPLTRVVPISPLAELGPLLALKTNQTLQLTEEEVALESPTRLGLRPGISAHIHIGGDERPAFFWQARTLAQEWACPWSMAPGRHHFDVIEDLADPNSALTASLLRL